LDLGASSPPFNAPQIPAANFFFYDLISVLNTKFIVVNVDMNESIGSLMNYYLQARREHLLPFHDPYHHQP
jgi:hypothetical protein